MRCPLLILPVGFTPLLLLCITSNIALSVAIAFFIGSKRVIGFWGSCVICIVASAIIGLIITFFFKTKQQKHVVKTADNTCENSSYMQHDIEHLTVLRQSGIISNKEYKKEVDRILNS